MTVIINVKLITMDNDDTFYPEGYLRFEKDTITEIGAMETFVLQPDETQIDGKGAILMPGMINTHTHLGMIPFRGLQDDAVDRLRRFLLPVEKAEMTAELVYAASKYAMAELLLSGVTTVMDMYYFEKEVAKAADDMNIRAFVGETIIDQDVCDAKTAKDSLRYAEELINDYLDHELITGYVAPHSPVTCSEETLTEASQIANRYDVPFSIHLAEMDYEMAYFKDNHNQSPIQFLDRLGILAPNLVAAHCIHATASDISLLQDKGAHVAHCIGANTKSAKGVAPISQMIESGIPIGLGTDGPSSGNTLDIMTQFKLVANFHKMATHDRSAFPAKDIVALGTRGGAKALGIFHKTGSLEVGKQADFVLVETTSVNMFPLYDPYSCLVYSANSKNVESVYIAGKCLVKDKQLVHENLEDLRHALYTTMNQKKDSLFIRELL